jgi:O-antigen/teichoic acid export membrane protein
MIIDKIQYSFIYLSYKSYRVKYRKGRGYQYMNYSDAAHRTVTILFALTFFISFAILTGGVKGNKMAVLAALAAVLVVGFYLDFAFTKKKLMKYRHIYPYAKRYILYFILFLIAMLLGAWIMKINLK